MGRIVLNQSLITSWMAISNIIISIVFSLILLAIIGALAHDSSVIYKILGFWA